ncbi:hypothetical protein NQ317_006790, partial [Molorchus minor]
FERATCRTDITRGFWSKIECQYHINYLKLLAIYYALRCFASRERTSNCTILFRVDNKTAIAYINRVGSNLPDLYYPWILEKPHPLMKEHPPSGVDIIRGGLFLRNGIALESIPIMGGVMYQNLNKLSRKIWSWYEQRNILFNASYITSKENTISDEKSRILHIESEDSLDKSIYGRIIVQKDFSEFDKSSEIQKPKPVDRTEREMGAAPQLLLNNVDALFAELHWVSRGLPDTF